MMLDSAKAEEQRPKLEKELESCGIRLNMKPPNIAFTIKESGGVSFNSTCKTTHLNEGLCRVILHEYRIHNAQILVREDCTVDDFIDVIVGPLKKIKSAPY